jgi:glycerol-3-phosphate dehydrogenase
VTGRDVVASWAGLRPLLGRGQGDAGTYDLSRKHAISEEPPGLLTITGGKLTTYRAMAEDLVDRLARSLGSARRCQTRRIPLGLHGPAEAAFRLAAAEAESLGLAPDVGIRLVRCYGDDWLEAIRMIGADRSLGERAIDDLPVLKVELELARSREMAITSEDIYVRRTRLTTRDASVPLPSG